MPKINELKAQKLMVDAVNEGGGFAYKCSHRFLVGVPDLFIKVPGFEPVFAECKICDMPKKSDWVRCEPTPLQLKFLREVRDVGLIAIVVSFMREGKVLRAAIQSLEAVEKSGFLICRANHTPLPLYDHLRDKLTRWKNQQTRN